MKGDTLDELILAGNRIREILIWHLAMPHVDHDGGDEDDRFVKERQFLRAIRQPRARWFREGDRAIVLQEPVLKPMPVSP